MKRYCELRIGIKPEPTKRDYLNGLLSVIAEQRIKYPDVTVKLLLSVARHSSVECVTSAQLNSVLHCTFLL